MQTRSLKPLDGVRPEIASEFAHWCQKIPPEIPLVPYAVTAEEVLRAHFLLAEYFGRQGEGMAAAGPRSLHLLQSAVSRQSVCLGSTLKWNTLFEVAATLFFGLIMNHPFVDANKRTALLTVLYQLLGSGRVPEIAQKDLEVLTVRIADHRLHEYNDYDRFVGDDDADVRFIAFFLKRATRDHDTRYYVITYRQLDAILSRFGARFANPHGNRIDVIQTVEEYRGILSFGKKRVEKRVTQIGFHDWGAEVARSDIKHVREALGLTPANNVDSPVFYQGVDPMESLIREYNAPLQRLARK
jgi:death-on-curing family protein